MGEPQADRRTVRVRIEGGVQGVGYRYWTERVAGELGLTGWVRNRRDGSVEALFAGPAADVAQMLERCKDGPRSAHVTGGQGRRGGWRRARRLRGAADGVKETLTNAKRVGWVKRSEDPTPAETATCVGSSLTLDPSYRQRPE